MMILEQVSRIRRRGWVFLFFSALLLHSGTPLIAEFFFELYHMTGFEWTYSAYGATRFLTSYYMVWPNRGLVVVAVALVIFIFLLWRAHRRKVR